MKALLRAGALAAVLLVGGCGSLCNLAEKPQVFGGVRWDINDGRVFECCSCNDLIYLDLPFSLAFDLLFLPLTALYEIFSR